MAFNGRLAGAVIGAAFLGYASLASAQEGPGVTKDEILFGSWSDLSGPLVSYGIPGVAGQDAYYKMVNDAGGINGRKIRVLTEDHLSAAARGRRCPQAGRK